MILRLTGITVFSKYEEFNIFVNIDNIAFMYVTEIGVDKVSGEIRKGTHIEFVGNTDPINVKQMPEEITEMIWKVNRIKG